MPPEPSGLLALCNKTAAEYFMGVNRNQGPMKGPLRPNSARLLVSAQALLAKPVSLVTQGNVTVRSTRKM